MTRRADEGAVLLVCADEERAFDLLDYLYESGRSVVGPVSTAGMALTLAALTPFRNAILIGETTGHRSAPQLADELTRTWGVSCLLMTS